MRIIFDNEEQKEKIINIFVENEQCPDDIGLPYNGCYIGRCKECWENSLEIEVKNDLKEIIESMAYEIFMYRNPNAYFCTEEEKISIMKEFGWK